jgi:hypothetical protein
MSTPIALQPTTPVHSRGRSILAIVAGFLVVAGLSTAGDAVLHALHVYPPHGQPMTDARLFLLALGYRIVFTVLGCWLAARLAPAAPMRHALILGGIGQVLSIVGVIVNMQADLGPDWYPILLAVTTLPCAWLGGRLHRPWRG